MLRKNEIEHCDACGPEVPDKGMVIYLHSGYGSKRHILTGIDSSSSIAVLKDIITKHVSIHPELQRLCARGQEIIASPETTLGQVHLNHQDHLLLAVRYIPSEEKVEAQSARTEEKTEELVRTTTLATPPVKKKTQGSSLVPMSMAITPSISELVGKEDQFSDVAFIIEEDDSVVFAHRVTLAHMSPLMV